MKGCQCGPYGKLRSLVYRMAQRVLDWLWRILIKSVPVGRPSIQHRMLCLVTRCDNQLSDWYYRSPPWPT